MAEQVEIIGPDGTKLNDCYKGKTIDIEYPCKSNTDCSQIEVKLPRGVYYLEVWGSQGQSISERGGYGGYSYGVYKTLEETTLYLHIGSYVTTEMNYGYNGGGKGSAFAFDGNGGGATDFRTQSGKWDENLKSRILVAGGGGGAYASSAGGDGGGINGTSGISKENGNKSPYGTQKDCSGGEGKTETVSSNQGYSAYYGAGGGGLFGGGSAEYAGGGGGSGYCGLEAEYKTYRGGTTTSNHTGKGAARITVLLFGKECNRTCIQTNYLRVVTNTLIAYFILKSSSERSKN